MNSFTQHVPSFCDMDAPAPTPFETTEDLLALEVLKRYSRKPGFSHFAMSSNALMEVSDGGYFWWVVGYVEHPELVDLPKWGGGRYRAELPTGERVELQADDVLSSCGEVLTLRNGTTARNLG
jgi:hypothetical protein